jgi:signal transduction histidine kinase
MILLSIVIVLVYFAFSFPFSATCFIYRAYYMLEDHRPEKKTHLATHRAGIISLCLFFGLPLLLSGQATNIDSIRNLSKGLEGKAKVDALNELSAQLESVNSVESLQKAKEAFALSSKIRYEEGKAVAMINEARCVFFNGNVSLSARLLRQSIAMSHAIKAVESEGYGLACLSAVFQSTEQLDSALIVADKSYLLLKNANQPYHLSFLFNAISDYYDLLNKPDSQVTYLRKAWAIRTKLKDKTFLPHSAIRLASYFVKISQYDSALSYLEKAQDAMGKDTIGNIEINLIQQHKALVFARRAEYKRAIFLFDKAKSYFEANHFAQELADLLLQTTEVFEEQGEYEASLKNAFDALSIAGQNHFELERAKALARISWSYYDLKQYRLCGEFTLKLLTVATSRHYQFELGVAYNLMGHLKIQEKKYDEARRNYERSLQIRSDINDTKGMSEEFYSLGDLYVLEGNLSKGLEYQFRSLQLSTSIHSRVGMGYIYARIGKTYILQNKLKEAEEYLTMAEDLARKIRAATVMIDVYDLKRQLYTAAMNLPLVTTYSKLYESLRDSLFNASVSNRISVLQNMFELDKRRQEIELQNAELLAQQNQIEQRNRVLIIVVIGLLVLMILSVLLLRNLFRIRQLNKEVVKQNADLLLKKDEIEAQNEELTQSNDEISLQRDLLTAQKNKLDEARELIREQNEKIKNQNKKLKKKVKKRTAELTEYVQQLEQFTFISSHNLRAPVARILGLGNLLELKGLTSEDTTSVVSGLVVTAKEIDRVVRDLNLILEIKRGHGQELTWIDFRDVLAAIRVTLVNEITNSNAIILDNFKEVPGLKSFRPYIDSILLNLVSNAIKYRRPNVNPVINIKTEFRGSFICLIVNDNSLGINLPLYGDKLFTLYKRFHDHVEGKGIGLYLVKTQVIALGGKLEVESEVNRGTTFYVYLRINDTEG